MSTHTTLTLNARKLSLTFRSCCWPSLSDCGGITGLHLPRLAMCYREPYSCHIVVCNRPCPTVLESGRPCRSWRPSGTNYSAGPVVRRAGCSQQPLRLARDYCPSRTTGSGVAAAATAADAIGFQIPCCVGASCIRWGSAAWLAAPASCLGSLFCY